MNILGVETLVYGVEDMDAAIRFFDDWGVPLARRERDGAVMELPNRTTIALRPGADPSLPPPPVPGSTVRETVWGVDDERTLAAIHDELARDRQVTRTPDGTLHAADDQGYALGFRVTQRIATEVKPAPVNTVGHVQRRDRRSPSWLPRRVRQQRIGHVVYWIPGDVEQAARFYVDRLGFRPTDTVTGIGKFLRCAGSNDHHNLFLHHRERNFGFQHASFELADLDEVMMCGNYMEQQGWKSHLGPGRHTLGSNTYWYFWNPAGGVVECYSDMDHITDDWEPQVHDTVPGGGSSWSVRQEDGALRPGHGDWPTLIG